MPAAFLRRSLVACLTSTTLAAAAPAAAQTLGTFVWQLQPYCNHYVFTATVDGAAIRLNGYDDQCGLGSQLPAVGSAVAQTPALYTLSFHVIGPNGRTSDTIATLNAADVTGPWIDQSGASGTLQFNQALWLNGPLRPSPSTALADGSITTLKIAAGAIDSTRIADGGIGTADLAADSVTATQLALPFSKTIASGTAALQLTNSASGGAATFVLSNTGSAARAVEARTLGGGPGVYAESVQGNGIFATTSAQASAGLFALNLAGGTGVVGQSSGDNGSGVVGLNTAKGNGVMGYSSGRGVGVFGRALTQVDEFGAIVGTGIAGRFQNEGEETNTAKVLEVTTKGIGNLIEASTIDGSGVPNPRFVVTAAGHIYQDGALHTPAADVAEFIDSADTLTPGDVVEIDRAISGHFRLAATASSTAVAGVVTTKPGVLMNAGAGREGLDDGPALALAGRVPVKVTAENGPIAPGDLLVSAPTPGHAMRAPDHPAPGTVIGKALGAHQTGTGVIEMLVMLR